MAMIYCCLSPIWSCCWQRASVKIRNLLVSCDAYLLFGTPIYHCGSSTVLLMVLVYNTSYALSLKALGNEISISAKVTRIWPPIHNCKQTYSANMFTSLLPAPNSDYVMIHLGGCNCVIFSHATQFIGVCKKEQIATCQMNQHMI